MPFMWIATVRLKSEASAMSRRCSRFKLTSLGLPLERIKDNDRVHYIHFESLSGDEARIPMLIEDMKNDPSISGLEAEGTSVFFIHTLPVQEPHPRKIKDDRVFFTKPIRTDETGFEKWHLASWDEQAIRNMVVALQKEHLEIEVISLEQGKLDQLFTQSIMPSLTESQRSALRLAAKRGYYNYPRKTELEILSGEGKLSLSTYRDHLRKAEKKIFEDMFGKPKSVEERLGANAGSIIRDSEPEKEEREPGE